MLLITGASGFVGQHLLSALEGYSPLVPAQGLSYLALSGTTRLDAGVQIDLRDPKEVANLFQQHRFDGIIHLAAESRTGICQADPAVAIAANTDATRNLLQAAAPQWPWFLYVSTDMVFSGEEGNYRESDSPNPIQEYGRSKALAEESVRAYPGKWCIVRPALIYGMENGGRQSMLSWTLENLNSGSGRFFTDEIRTPVWVDDLVKLLITLYRNEHSGILHAGGPNRVSRYDFACAVAREWEIPLDQVKAGKLSDLPDAWWRPKDLSLVSFEAERYVHFTPIAEALRHIHESGTL